MFAGPFIQNVLQNEPPESKSNMTREFCSKWRCNIYIYIYIHQSGLMMVGVRTLWKHCKIWIMSYFWSCLRPRSTRCWQSWPPLWAAIERLQTRTRSSKTNQYRSRYSQKWFLVNYLSWFNRVPNSDNNYAVSSSKIKHENTSNRAYGTAFRINRTRVLHIASRVLHTASRVLHIASRDLDRASRTLESVDTFKASRVASNVMETVDYSVNLPLTTGLFTYLLVNQLVYLLIGCGSQPNGRSAVSRNHI